MEAEDGIVGVTVYTDGSGIHADHPDTVRLGWSFIFINKNNRCVAIARGAPPDYVGDITGAEALAILQAVRSVMHGSTYKSDCRPGVDANQLGQG